MRRSRTNACSAFGFFGTANGIPELFKLVSVEQFRVKIEPSMSKKVILSGVTPSGNNLHIGNYFGMLKPLVDLGRAGKQVYCFVSDVHALTTVKERRTLEENVHNIVINYLACGVDEANFVFFRQSEVPAHSELAIILNNYVGVGHLQRMHAFKDKLQKGVETGEINMGLFDYPVLMAADILLYSPDLVPVGVDQRQHVEITRDIAESFNRTYKSEIFKLPEALIDEQVGRIVGTDGERKMSKSLGNVVDIFADYGVIEKQIRGSFTDPNRKSASDPGKVEGNPVFTYHDLWNENGEEVADLKRRYQAGKVGDVEVKEKLLAAHKKYFAAIRERKEYFEAHPEEVEKVLARGRAAAAAVAEKMLVKVQKTCGLRVNFSAGQKNSSSHGADAPAAEISIDDFMKVEMRVGLVTAASEPEWSDKLIKQEVDFGEFGKKVIFSAMRKWYAAADFVNKKFVYITNLPPRKMGEEFSEGMIVATEAKDGPVRWDLTETDVEPGQRVG